MEQEAFMLKTRIIKLDINNLEMDKLEYASNIIKKGGLVAFPTETVYGLGANALNEKAVRKIYQAKGRPPDNPLIVHIADKQDVNVVSKSIIDGDIEKLIENFWPGPLTLVLEKSNIIPFLTTAGLDTVAVRIPSHPIALALIKMSGVPIGAPSANSSGKPSPTRAEHVINDLSGKVDVIIDAGISNIGLESTVLDVTLKPPMILRPGGITPLQISNVIGLLDIDPAIAESQGIDGILVPKSPGVKYKHYSPAAKVFIVEGNLFPMKNKIVSMSQEYIAQGYRVGIMATNQTKDFYKNGEVISLGDRDRPESIASNLFDTLREFDNRKVQVVFAESISNIGIGLAIMNRLNKAAAFNIIKVESSEVDD